MAPLVGDAAGDGDVLVARATPAGTGALAIVRLSGPPGRVLALARALAPRIPARPRGAPGVPLPVPRRGRERRGRGPRALVRRSRLVDRRGGRRAAGPRLPGRRRAARLLGREPRGPARPAGRVHATGAREREGRPGEGRGDRLPRGGGEPRGGAAGARPRPRRALAEGGGAEGGAPRRARGAGGAARFRRRRRDGRRGGGALADRLRAEPRCLLLAAETGAGRAPARSRPSSSSAPRTPGSRRSSTRFSARTGPW